MSNKKKQKRSAPRGSGTNSLLVIIVSLILIAIPLTILGSIVYESYMEAGEPILGDRFTNDLTSEISEDQIENVVSVVRTIARVESVDANLQSGTLKLLVDLVDTITLEELLQTQMEVYNGVAAVLPVETYFTKTESARNYDLEISLYNNSTSFDLHAIVLKNSSMAEPKLNLVSSPLSEETTQKILDELNNSDILDDGSSSDVEP